MTGFVVRRSGFVTVGELMASVVTDLVANGFKAIFPTPWAPPVTPQKWAVTLEATETVDPLNATAVTNKQPWRIRLETYDQYTASLVVGSQLSLPDTGAQSWLVDKSDTAGPLGVVGGKYTNGTGINRTPLITDIKQGFLNRKNRVMAGAVDLSASYPMSYYMCITPRGMFLDVWEDLTTDTLAIPHAWLLVQRPVDRKTGAVVVTGKAPVFALMSVGGVISKMVVRESDVLRPSELYDATTDTTNSAAVINAVEQVAISEGNQYVVSFPARLNTPRYAYTYELDMLGYTSSDVVAENTYLPLRVYGEAADRRFVAMHANKPNNAGMRIVALNQGGGITP